MSNKTSPKSMKNAARSSKENIVWKHTQSNQKNVKNYPQTAPNKRHLFRRCRLLGHLWWPNLHWDIKNWPPALPKCFQWSEIEQKWYKRTPRLQKRAPKVKLFQGLAWRTERSTAKIGNGNGKNWKYTQWRLGIRIEIVNTSGRIRKAESSTTPELSLDKVLKETPLKSY